MHRARMEVTTRSAVRVYVYRRTLGVAAAAMAAAALYGACVLDTKTNLCEVSGRRCEPGQVCAADQDACISIGGCGDGIVSSEKGEVCDDGNIRNGDKCSSDCKSDTLCGNGAIDLDEECDAGVGDSRGCDYDCSFVVCGDGHLNKEADEECDTGNPGSNTEMCNGQTCKLSQCGDSIFNATAGEKCDTGGDSQGCNGDGNGDSANDLTQRCLVPQCGDGYTNKSFRPPGLMSQFEMCDTGEDSQTCNGSSNIDGLGNCQVAKCGDGYANMNFTPPGGSGAPEKCDTEGNTPECNGYDNTSGLGNCQKTKCGDGYKNPSYTVPGIRGKAEECDAGENTQNCNGNDNSDGLGNCQNSRCGDGYKNTSFKVPGMNGTFEACDDGGNSMACNGDDNLGGRGNCQFSQCGDGYRNPSFRVPGTHGSFEECDNGGNSMTCNGKDNSDGRGNCQFSQCGDGYLNAAAGEGCDKGRSPGIPQVGCSGGTTCSSDCVGCV